MATVRRWINRGFGLYIVLAALAAALLTVVVLTLLERIAADPPYETDLIPDRVHWLIAHRWLASLLAAPALLIGILLATVVRRFGMLVMTVGILALLLPLGAVLYCFLELLAPMYGM